MRRRLSPWFRRWLHIDPVHALGKDSNLSSALLASVNDSAKQASAVLITFVASAVYVAITAAATTDDQLFLNSPVSLPLFNVGVPALYFYRVAPLLVCFLHLNLLLLEFFVAYRFYRLPGNIRSGVSNSDQTALADSLFLSPSLLMRLLHHHNRPIRFLLRLVFVFIAAILPVIVLLVLQVKILPAHDTECIHLLRSTVVLDLLLLWFFFLLRPRSSKDLPETKSSRTPGDHGRHRFSWRHEILAIAALSSWTLLAVFYSFWVVSIPLDCGAFRFSKFTGHRSLRLSDRVFSVGKATETLSVLGGHRYHAILQSARDLRCANFSGSSLVEVDFRGSDLTGANFSGADLARADFSPLGSQRPSGNPSSRAGLAGVFYEDKNHRPTRLEGAIFARSDLREASFHAAKLANAHFENAELGAADFSFAEADNADFSGAILVGGDLKAASLRHANFQGAQLQAASLASARAEYAIFLGSSLEGADLLRLHAAGAEFRGSVLQGANGLPLEGLDLRQAKMASVSFCDSIPRFLDLRDIDMRQQAWSDPVALTKDLGGSSAEVRKRLEGAQLVKLCLSPKRARSVLYSPKRSLGYLKQWPEPLDQDTFCEQFSTFLMERSCSADQAVRLAMAQRVVERLVVDPEDCLANRLVRLLRKELLSPTCEPRFSFSGHEDLEREVLRRSYFPR